MPIDIVEAADSIAAFLSERDDEDGFRRDELLKSAVLQKLTVIGEAAGRIGTDLKQRHSEIPWADVVAFRHNEFRSNHGE